MHKLFAAALALLFCTAALAADVVATLTLSYNGQRLFSQTNSFFGLTDAEAKALRVGAMKQLDFASRRQGAESCTSRCPYSIEWSWSGESGVVTERHTFAQVNQILRQGTRWLDDRIAAAEGRQHKGHGKPWGN